MAGLGAAIWGTAAANDGRFISAVGSKAEIVQIHTDGNRPHQDKEEVIVVGGSAAGLYTAAKVAHGGKRVRVLESKRDLQPAPRTLIVTNHFRTQLRASADESTLNEIRRFELFTDGRSAQIALAKPDLPDH